MSDPQPQRIFVGMSRLEIENCAPLGPARNIVVYTEAGHAYRFKVLQFRTENDGMVEVYDLSDKAEELTEPRGFDYPSGVPLTDEEAAELERRLREELSKPHEPRQFKYPVVGLPTVTAPVTENVVQVADPDEPGKFFLVHFAASCDRIRPWSVDLPDRIVAALQDSVSPTESSE